MKQDKELPNREEVPKGEKEVKERVSLKEVTHNMIANGWNKRSNTQRLIIIIALALVLIINYILVL